jgi:hypothetical protein
MVADAATGVLEPPVSVRSHPEPMRPREAMEMARIEVVVRVIMIMVPDRRILNAW